MSSGQTPDSRPRLGQRLRMRLAAVVMAAAAVLGFAALGPLTATASATVYDQACSSNGVCPAGENDAVNAANFWEQAPHGHWPTARAWEYTGHTWIYHGGRYYDYDRQLRNYGSNYYGAADTTLYNGPYYEYDVYGHTSTSASRGAARLVRNSVTGDVFFSPDHYSNFYYIGTWN